MLIDAQKLGLIHRNRRTQLFTVSGGLKARINGEHHIGKATTAV